MPITANSRHKPFVSNPGLARPTLFDFPGVAWWIAIICLFGLFWVSIELATESCLQLGSDFQFFIGQATSSVLTGFSLSIILTAIVQSSSVITALSVALVASNMLSLEAAVPIIIGANLGTTITATAVSLTYLTRRKYFRKAFGTSLLHTFFNIWGVLIWFVLEANFQLLSRISAWMAHLILPTRSPKPVPTSSFQFLPFAAFEFLPAGFWLCFSLLLLLSSIYGFSRLLGKLVLEDIQRKFSYKIFVFWQNSFWWGMALTALLRSSTVVTSALVPLSATYRLSAKRIFPFIIGVNVGTTITALLAAIFRNETALSLALAHFLFNSSIAILFVPAALAQLTIKPARKLARLASRQRIFAFFWLFLLYFFFPLLAFLWSQLDQR